MLDSTSVQELATTVPGSVIDGVLAAGLILVVASLISGLVLKGVDAQSSSLIRAVRGISTFIGRIAGVMSDTRSPRRGRRTATDPVNWNQLSADDAEREWLALNQWVEWLRFTYQLPDSVVPSYWHRHPGLVWELSALHSLWISAYSPEQLGPTPLQWHREFADARERLRAWVAVAATETGDAVTTNRDADFLMLMADDVNRRRVTEKPRGRGILAGRRHLNYT